MLKFPENLKNPKAIVIMFHGYGATPSQWMSRVPYIQKPNILYVAPSGFNSMQNGRYHWFEIIKNSEFKMTMISEGTEYVRPLIISMIDALAKEYNVPYENIILVGFSQGAMIALDIVTHHPHLKYAIGVAGMLVKTTSTDPVYGDKNILLIHGTEDTVVPYHFALEAEKELKKEGSIISLETCKNLGHSINEQVLKAIENFFNSQVN